MILTEKEMRTFKRIQQSDACAQNQRPIEWSDVKVLGINRAYHKAYKLVHDSFGNVDLNNNMHLELLGIGYIAHSKSRDFDRLNFKQQQIAVSLFQKGQDQALKTRQIEQNIGDLLGVVPTYGTGLKTFVTKFSADVPLLNGENIAKFDRHFFTQDYAYHMQNLHMDDTGDRLYLGRTVFNIKHELIKSTQDLSAAQLKLDDELVKLSNLTQLSKETLLEHAREYQSSLQKELNTFSSTYALKMDTMSDDMKGMLSYVIHNQLQRKQEREREQEREEQQLTFANNVKASQGLFEDIKVVASVFNNRKLEIVANIGQAQVKICTALSELKTTFPAIQGLLSSNGALGKALSGLSMVAPYMAIGVAVLSIASQFMGNNSVDPQAEMMKSYFSEVFRQLSYISEQLSELTEDVRELRFFVEMQMTQVKQMMDIIAYEQKKDLHHAYSELAKHIWATQQMMQTLIQELRLDDFKTMVNAVNITINSERVDLEHTLVKHSDKVRIAFEDLWMLDNFCSASLNGAMINHGDVKTCYRSIVQENLSLEISLGYIYRYIRETFDWAKNTHFNLPNVSLWRYGAQKVVQNRLFELNQACFYQTPARIIKDDERLKALLGISDSTLQFISLLREKRQDVYHALFKQHQSIIASLSYTLGRNILTKLKNTSESVSLVEAIQQGIITCSSENIGEGISSVEFLKKLSTVTANQHVFMPWSVLVACQLGVASVELVCHFKEGSRVAATCEDKFNEQHYEKKKKKKALFQPFVYSLKGKFDFKINLKIPDNTHNLFSGILHMGNLDAFHGAANHNKNDRTTELSRIQYNVVNPMNLWTNKELFIKSQVASSSLTEANLNYGSFEAAFVTEILNQLHTQAHQLRPNIGQVFDDACNQVLQHGQADDKSYETLFESLAVIQKTSVLIGGLIGLNEADSLALLTYFKTDWSAIMNHLDTLQSDATKAAFNTTLEGVSEFNSHIYRDMQGTQLCLQELRSNVQMFHRYNIYRENWIALSQALLRMKLPFQALMKLNGNGSDQVHDDFLQLQNALEDTRLVLNEAYQPLHLTFSTLLSVEDIEDGFSQDTAVKTEHLSEIMAQQTALMDFDMMTFKTLLGEMTQYFGDMAVVINRPILLMGRSKAAKTTVANFLCGVDFLKTEEGLIPLSEARGIGQTGLSETDYPEWFITESGLNIIDNPGFDDNRGTEEDIIGAISTQIRAKQYQDIKNIVFACPYSDIMEDSYTANLINALFTIGSLFKNKEDIAKHLKLAVTFLDGDVSSDQETVSAIIKRLKRWQQTTLAGLRNVKKSAIITHVLDALTEQNIYCVHPDIAHTRAKLLDGFFDGDDVMDKADVNFTHYSCALSKFRSVSDGVIKYEQALITAMTTLTTAVFGAIYKQLPDIKTCLFDEKASMITRDFMDIHQQLIDNRQQLIEFLSPYQLQMSGNTTADSYQVLKNTLQEWTACQAIFDEFKRLLAIINGQTASSQSNAFFQRRSASNESVANDLNL